MVQQLVYFAHDAYNKLYVHLVRTMRGQEDQQVVTMAYSFAEGLPQTGFRFCHTVSKFVLGRR